MNYYVEIKLVFLSGLQFYSVTTNRNSPPHSGGLFLFESGSKSRETVCGEAARGKNCVQFFRRSEAQAWF